MPSRTILTSALCLALGAVVVASCDDSRQHTPARPDRQPATTAPHPGSLPPDPPRARAERHLISEPQLHRVHHGMPFGTVLSLLGPPDTTGTSRANPCVIYTVKGNTRRVKLCFPAGRLGSVVEAR